MNDRRRERRWPAAAANVGQATLRPGCPVRVVDLSAAGVQVESERPLRPGALVHVRFSTADCTVTVAARVLRCTVAAIHPEAGVTYRGALHFQERCRHLAAEAAGTDAAEAVV